jgi:uncharacterized protein with beta-barrel porin domain
LEGNTGLTNQISLDAWVRAAWMHEFDPSRSIDSSFISAPGFNFVVEGAQPPRDALATTVGLKLNITKTAAIFGTFEGEFAQGGANSVGGTGGIVFYW